MKLFMYLFTFTLQISRSISFQNKAASFNNINRHITTSPILNARPKKTDKYISTDKYDNYYNNKTDKFIHKPTSSLYKPRSDNQLSYVKHLTDVSTPIVVGVGPAGSGKTLFACIQAVSALNAGFINKIILTRPIVPVEEDMGFLPGDLKQKMDPWTRPIFDILLEFYQQKDIDSMLDNGVLEISPLAYMRGRTFKNAFIIADEMQNSSPNQMLMLTTRIGDKSKLVITGDLQQCDRGTANGLADFIEKVRSYEISDAIDRTLLGKKKDTLGIRIIEMKSEDIQRSHIVTKLIDIYSGKPKVPQDSLFPLSREIIVEPGVNLGPHRITYTNNTNNNMNDTEINNTIHIYNHNLNTYYSKNNYDGDAALMPVRYNTTDSNKFPWQPMDI